MGFTNIANTVSANQDEEVWVELHFYIDHKQLDDVSTKMEKDEKCRSTLQAVHGSHYPGILHRGAVQPHQRVDNITKVLFSKTLKKVADNAILIKENIAEEISKMKQQPGKDLMLQCGTGLVSTFIQSGLIDEYRIGVVPIILGAGNSLSEALKDKLNLKLLKTKTFNSGLVLLHYQLA